MPEFVQRAEVKATAAFLVVAGTLGGFAAAGTFDGGPSHNADPSQAALAVSSMANCDNIHLGNPAFSYDGTFLPKAETPMTGPDSAAKYVQGLFSKGPLGSDASAASMAVVDAITTEPATATSTNNATNYLNEAANVYNKLTNPQTAEATAKEVCDDMSVVLGSTEDYDSNAISKGEQYLAVTPTLGKSSITGINMVQKTARQNVSGVTFEERLAKQIVTINGVQHNIYGFPEVVFDSEGNIYIPGALPMGGQQPGNEKTPSGQQPTTSLPAGTKPTVTTPGGKTTITLAPAGGSGSTPGSTKGVGGPVGPAPGKAPSFGTTPGSGEFPTGPSVPPEQGGPTPTTPPSTSPPETAPPTTSPPETTVPPTTTPPTTTPPTTTPPTTTPPTTTPTTTPPTTTPVKGPAPCDPVAQECN